MERMKSDDGWNSVNGIYQIYPRSFRDADADGVGDLAGITERLEYLRGSSDSLGIDAVWLSPFFTSPMRDFGYDVSDYTDVDPTFGTLEDFDKLIDRAHELGVAVMIDFVPNHTSSDHPWFQEALRSKESDKRDYYIFKDPVDGGYPNNWLSVFGGSAWEYNEETGQYYLHSFLAEQPDLNWENPNVQEEIKQIVRFWFDRGVDGIRVDAIRWMGKDLQFLDDEHNPNFQTGDDPYHIVRHVHSRFSPELDGYLRCITEVAKEYDDKLIILEDHLDDLTPMNDQITRMYNIDPGIAAPFNFQGMHIPFSARAFGEMVTNYQTVLPEKARAFYCFSNHDESRIASRFGETQARMLAVLQLMLPGIPVVYYGQEIGMHDSEISPEDVQDPFEKRVPGRGLGRDPQRTPMQWDTTEHAGFSDADTTWLPVDSSYKNINVKQQQTDEQSFLRLYQDLLRLRDECPVIASEQYETEQIDDALFVFSRTDDTDKFVVVLNFTDQAQAYEADPQLKCLLSAQGETYQVNDTIEIAPFDGVVLWRDVTRG